MSEYQYYEFQAVDRPLDAGEREALRAISTRARITATSFVNSYEWGDLKADPMRLLEQYFDLFFYLANWGERRLAMRLPRRLIDAAALARFRIDPELASIRRAGEHVLIDIHRPVTEDEDEGWDDGGGWLGALAPLRADLLDGDLRLFTLLWLAEVETGARRDGEAMPSPGLAPLTGALAAMARLLRIGDALLQAAAGDEVPADRARPSPGAVRDAIRALPEDEKLAFLLRLHAGDDPHLGAALRRRCREAAGAPPPATGSRRTAGELRAQARRIEDERRRIAAERDAARLRREAEAQAREKSRRLVAVAARGEDAWREAEAAIELRNASGYARATALLVDLREIADRDGRRAAFNRRLAEVRERHDGKKSLLRRLDAAGLVLAG